MFENVCFVCDLPTKLSLDSQNQLHAEWEYAMQFADDYGVYAYHGVGERPEGKKCTNDQYIKLGTKVTGYLPQAQMHDFIIELRSLTFGVGFFVWKQAHLQEVPERLAKEILTTNY